MTRRLPELVTLFALTASVGCEPQPDIAPGGSAASQASLEADVRAMASDFLARRAMRGLDHDMPLSSAYGWQDVFIDEASASLGAVVGYKTGGHDPGPGFPVFPLTGIRGAILEGMLRASGDTLTLEETRRGFLEADFAVRVGSERINTAVTDLEILSALDAIIPFAEVPDPYYEAETRTINGTVVANMGSRYSFTGTPIPLGADSAWLDRLDNFTFAVHDESGRQVEAGTIRGWYRPIEVIRWLRDSLVEGGKRLKPGDLMSLGNIGIIRQLHEGSPRGPAYRSGEFTLSYYGFGDAPASVTIAITR